ncbi:GNAT family N-acetyltransferase [Nocardiopsis aegyptia]|uniref:GNAT family N-acetyltransferase n=1 Tax=Nocardiopsis aegyptia TaxID=220378 RepID=UPI003670BBB7
MTPSPLPPWPVPPPAHGRVVLRRPTAADIPMVRALSTDPYVPTIGSLTPNASTSEASAWVHRQHDRYTAGAGFSFTIADAGTDTALGFCGLWLRDLAAGRATVGYAVAPSARGRGVAADALAALTDFGWSFPELFRIEAYIEPWNTASVRTAERVGYVREGLLRGHQAIGGRRCDMLIHAAVRAAPGDGP